MSPCQPTSAAIINKDLLVGRDEAGSNNAFDTGSRDRKLLASVGRWGFSEVTRYMWWFDAVTFVLKVLLHSCDEFTVICLMCSMI